MNILDSFNHIIALAFFLAAMIHVLITHIGISKRVIIRKIVAAAAVGVVCPILDMPLAATFCVVLFGLGIGVDRYYNTTDQETTATNAYYKVRSLRGENKEE